MKQITRTMTTFLVRAYDLREDETGAMNVEMVAEATVFDTSLSKPGARAALNKANNCKLPRGVPIKWEPISTTTYALPIDKFMELATIVDTSAIA